MTDTVITIDRVSKVYRLYKKHVDRVKETFHPFRKKYFRPFTALNGISFNVQQGETIGVIGRNGSGKSTLLQIICGILQPSAGSVSVAGQISALLELGAGFNPEFSGRENVFLNASILGFSTEEIERKYADIARFADIGEFIDQPVKTYSSGMYIRLAFSIAVHVDPEILIVDEALAVGDIFFQQKCIQHMQNAMHACTKVITTHDMQMVANMCERVIVLDRGAIIFQGSPLKGIEYYQKLVHNEVFERGSGIVETENPAAQTNVAHTIDPDGDWIAVPEDSRGGAREVVIEKVKITTTDNMPVEIVKAGDNLLLHFLVRSKMTKRNIIFGYTIKDRVGNAIFGENTVGCADGLADLDAGYHHVRLGITWPEIYPTKYTVTFGVGEGEHPFNHTIQCWAHNMISVSAISPNRCIHAIFNNPITGIRISSL